MRGLTCIPAVAAFALLMSGTAHAATWIEYKNQGDHFGVSLPGEPTVSDMMIESEYGEDLPAHKYTVAADGINYTVIVVDYSKASNLNDIRGSMEYAAAAMRRTGKVTFDAYEEIDRIPGIQVQVTRPNKKRVFAGFNLYNKRLYELIAEAPMDAPPPEGFRASLTVLDDNGNAIRLDDNGQPLRRGGAADGPRGGSSSTCSASLGATSPARSADRRASAASPRRPSGARSTSRMRSCAFST